jgi:hypothetical protein
MLKAKSCQYKKQIARERTPVLYWSEDEARPETLPKVGTLSIVARLISDRTNDIFFLKSLFFGEKLGCDEFIWVKIASS